MNRRHFLTAAASAGLALTLRTRADGAPAKLRVGIIGHTGRGNYGHGLDVMWRQLPETEIVAVADADAKGLAAAQSRLKVAQGFPDYRQMLAEAKPDLVAICPRHVDQHYDMALSAVAAGARGIYMEKPFCRTPAEADEIVAACSAREVRLALAHRNRWHPVLPVVQKLIADGAIGHVLEMRARGKEDQRGGSLDLWVLGSHLLNVATVFGGKPLTCSATVLQNQRPIGPRDVRDGAEGIGTTAGDEVHARFEMERGFPLFFDSIKGAGNATAGFGLQIVGNKGIVDLRADEEPFAHLLTGGLFSPRRLPPLVWMPVTSAGPGHPEPVLNLGKLLAGHSIPARDLIASMHEGREPLCSARDGRTTVEMISAVFASHRLGGQRISLPLSSRENPLLAW